MPGTAEWSARGPNARPNRLWLSWSIGWSRKNSTRWSASACFSATVWLLLRGSRRSRPPISAPIRGVSAVTVISLIDNPSQPTALPPT